MNATTTALRNILVGSVATVMLTGCPSGIDTPQDTKHLSEFHQTYFQEDVKPLDEKQLTLFVDYSKCMKLGQESSFFQDVQASFVNRTIKYVAIKGDTLEEKKGDVYTLLRTINEVDYAELKKAAEMAANGYCEAVLLTDGEYFKPTEAKGNDTNPYLENAFKTWILKGYDIHIIAEPYTESNKGVEYKKKRFYIIFTDDRNTGNVYNRICKTVDFKKYQDVDHFHISASHPQMFGSGNNSSTQHQVLNSKSKGYGDYEIQEWQGCDWETIGNTLVVAYDPNTGEPLETGENIMELAIDKNSFGCYAIEDLDVKVYDINALYNGFYDSVEAKVKPQEIEALQEVPNFMEYDRDRFKKDGVIDIRFNQQWFDPSQLEGTPYNYLKIDLAIKDVRQVFDSHKSKFLFPSIWHNGATNESVVKSITQCLADKDVEKKLSGQVFYSIYVKSEKK